MSYRLRLVAYGLTLFCFAVQEVSAGEERLKVPVSVLADSLEYKGVSIREEKFTVWGAAPIQDDGGKVHLYAARWPEPNVNPAWRKSSEIAHYESDSPEGPFRFVDVVVKGSGKEGAWDRYTAHNPEVVKDDDTYALLYVANSNYRQPPHPRNQSIGMVTSKSPYGPWNKVGDDGLILDDEQGHFSEGMQVVNPALIEVGQRYHLYYKTALKQETGFKTVYGLAIADRLEGPYVHQPEPVTVKGVTIEDAAVFRWDEKICLLTTDNHGLVTGKAGALVLWVSDNGLDFKREWIQLGMWLFPDYLSRYDSRKVKRIYGRYPKAERPKVLSTAGRPAYLYAASGWIYDGSPRCINHLFKINLSEGDSPVPERGEQAE